MPITATDKIKINKYIKEHAVGDIYYLNMCDALNKKVKITDVEFLEYFTDCVVNDFNKNTKIYINHLTKIICVIDTFLEWINEAGSIVKEETLDKIRSFKEYYDEYLNRTGLEIDKEFVSNIEMILEKVNKLYPCKEKSESVIKYISKIEELTKSINELKKKLAEITELYDNLQGSYNKKNDKIKSLNGDLVSQEEEIRSKSKEIDKLNKTIKALNAKIIELENLLSKKEEDNASLSTYKEQYELIKLEVEKLKEEIKKEIALRMKEAHLKDKQSKIEELIYQKLLIERVSFDEIVNYLKKQGFDWDRNVIDEIFKRVKKYVNIDSSFFSGRPTYRIVAPSVLKDEQFSINLPSGCKYYDVMLVSDFHIREFNNKIQVGFDVLDDYCVKNDINLILNLGDFYHGVGNLNYQDAVRNYKLVEQTINQVPKAEGVYHAILGGNHEKNILRYGFNPIKMLADAREDFIDLGYDHSTIVLKNSLNNILGRFDIHHPDTFDFAIDFDESGISMDGLRRYLNEVYQKQGRTRDSSYIDAFGHVHKSQFNYVDSYCYIPPYFDGSTKRACHLRIYIDDEKQIKYMVFMPLTATNQLVKTNEIIYQKILKK